MQKKSLNKVILIGDLERDPEYRYTPSGTAVLRFNLSTHETRRKQDGETYDWTEWHKIVAFGELAEAIGPSLKRGQVVYVDGHIRSREWDGKDGTHNTITEVIADRVSIFGKSDIPKDEKEEESSSADQEELPF